MKRTPIVRPVSWLNVGVNLAIGACFLLAGWYANPRHGVVLGVLAFVGLSLLLRRVVAGHHRKAIALVKRQQFQSAIAEFQKSLSFFRKHPWVDDWRALTMLSASGMTYREMALVSLGFCYAQIGDGVRSREHYEQCLREFPDNGMAESAIRLMDAARNAQDGAQQAEAAKSK